MKKRKKNNKPFIILIIGLLVFGSLVGFSIYKMNEHKEYVEEHYAQFERDIAAEKVGCEEKIALAENAIETLENEITTLEKEITSIQRQMTDEFMSSRGWSDKYYALEDQRDAKYGEIDKKREEISKKKSEITDFNSTIWKIDNEFGDYKYKQPGFQNGNPYLLLGLGIVGCIITFWIAGISQLFKSVMSEKSYSEYKEIDEGILSEIDVKDGNLLKKEFYGRLESLLLASSNNDYDTIRALCTKNMAKRYVDEMDLLKKHKQKLVIKNIENVSSKIVSARRGQNNTTITIVQKIKLYDYTKDSNGEVVNGNEKKKQTQAFRLVFVKDYVKGHSVKRCPNCGANIKNANSVKCDYCGTVFDNSNYDWYLESKVIISED